VIGAGLSRTGILKERVDGYAAVMDAPCLGLVAELLEVYPDAIVICATREPEVWAKSMAVVSSASTMVFLRFILFLLPGMRLFPDYISVLRKQWMYFYGEREAITRKTYEEP
jgi:hypothetical protein